MLGRPIEELKIVTCHLGNGASICAVKNGKSIETSMGFTPLQGLAMGTRSGTIDPAVISFLMDKEKMTVKDVSDFLNKKSGVLGVSGVSSDFRDVQEAAENGNNRAILALDIFCYKVKRFIGDYIGIMNGADAVVFTAGIGENNDLVRSKILKDLDFLGIEVDMEKNKVIGKEIDISAPGSRVKTIVIPTNEELAIARETQKLLK
jgi:acetate kinase